MENKKIVSMSQAERFDTLDNYPHVRWMIAERINLISKSEEMKGHYLYQVIPKTGKKLHKIFLDNLPEDARQHYTCNCCLMFINRIGNLVTIDDDGKLHSVCWDVPLKEAGMFAPAFNELRKAVESGTIRNVFSYDERSKMVFKKDNSFSHTTITLGIPETGEWNHFYGVLDLGKIYVPQTLVSEEQFRDKIEVSRVNLNKWNAPAIKKAIAYADSEELYNKDKVKSQCEKLLSIIEKYKVATNRNARIKLYYENNELLYHIGGSSIGTLLDDFQDGSLSDAECIDRYNSKTDPIRYKRAQSAPSEANIKQAEKLLKEIGAENSIKRRFALMEDIPKFLWRPKEDEEVKETYREGIFANIKSKEDEKDDYEKVETDGGTITVSKLIKKILPEAEKMDVYVGFRNRGDFCAYTTAVNMDSARIIKYDNEDQRNPISQYMYSVATSPSQWNIFDNIVECVGIVNFPEDIYNDDVSDSCIVFILKHCYDTKNKASAIFADNLIPQLFSIRKVLEAYSNQTPLEVPEGQKVCGLVAYGNNMDIRIKVHTKYAITNYRIDRME